MAVGKYIFLGLCILVIIGNLYSLVARKAFKKQLPLFLGFGSAIVASGSMEPEIMTGEMVFVVKQRTYKEGQVVSYRGNNTPITHKIMRVVYGEDGKPVAYVTAGVNNLNPDGTLSEDGEIPAEKIIGRVFFHSMAFGQFVEFLQSPTGVLVLVLLGAAIYFVPEMLSKNKQNKQD